MMTEPQTFEQFVIVMLIFLVVLFFLRSFAWGQWAPPEMEILRWLFEPFFRRDK
jgi:hypothetical protein